MARPAGVSGGETADRVRAAALALFASRGYAAVSMREIAAMVGLRASAIYNHFPTKQDILADLMITHMRALIAAWEDESHRYSEPRAALAGFVRFHIRYHVGRQDEVFVSYMELRSLEAPHFAEVETLRRVYEGFLRKILRAGVGRAEFDIPDIPVATMALIAMLTGVTSWFRESGRLSIDGIEKIYVKMALGSVCASPEAESARADSTTEVTCSTQA